MVVVQWSKRIQLRQVIWIKLNFNFVTRTRKQRCTFTHWHAPARVLEKLSSTGNIEFHTFCEIDFLKSALEGNDRWRWAFSCDSAAVNVGCNNSIATAELRSIARKNTIMTAVSRALIWYRICPDILRIDQENGKCGISNFQFFEN